MFTMDNNEIVQQETEFETLEVVTPEPEKQENIPFVDTQEQMVQKYKYVGFMPRAVAYIIDSIIGAFAGAIIRLPVLIVSVFGVDVNRNLLFHFNIKDILSYIAVVAYFVILTYYCGGATLGKKLMNIKVIALDRENRFLDILYRETVGRFLSSLLCIGYIVGAVEPEKRCFHDMLADTRVVYNLDK